jgi:hypothetical protein
VIIRYLSLIAIGIGMTIAPCGAAGQGGLFRDAYACPDRGGPTSVCVYGKIPAGKQVTLIAKGWKSASVPKETFSNENEEFQNGEKTSTRLQAAKPPPKDAMMIAVLADAKDVNELPLQEIQDEAAVERISRYIKSANGLNLDPDIRFLKTRLLRLSPTILLSESLLASPGDEDALRKELPTGCGDCEIVPLWVGQDLVDLFKAARSEKANSVERTCGGIKMAFTLSGRMHLLSHAFACESDSYSGTFVHDLSGAKPKLVFKLAGGL